MSIFQAETNGDGNDNASFEDLVGDGKRYKTPEDLAKGKLEADRTIKLREKELADLREELARRMTIEQALEKASKPPVEVKPPVETQPKQEPREEVDIDARVQEAINRDRQAQRREENARIVEAKLLEVYGDESKANAVLKQTAVELGVSIKELEDQALKNPKAFFKLIGVPESKPAATHQPSKNSWGSVNVQAKATTPSANVIQPGTYKYYLNLRRENPAKYFSPETQLQMDKDARAAKAEGRDFFA